MKKYTFTTDQRDRLLDLLREQRAGVAKGEITGFGQHIKYELQDIDDLIFELED